MTASDTTTDPDVPRTDGSARRPLVEIGCIAWKGMDQSERQAVSEARTATLQYLQQTFPEFDWQMPLLWRRSTLDGPRQESTELLDFAVSQRDLEHWDFVILVTTAELVSHYKNEALAALSRSLDAMVISTAHLETSNLYEDDRAREHPERTARRIQALMLHGIGHLNGLDHAADEDNFMRNIGSVQDLDELLTFNAPQLEEMRANLTEIADWRLEEQEQYQRVWPVSFYLSSVWINWHEVLDALWQAKPWQFPFRLSRLTTAAMSAMLVLLMTEEVWALSTNQNWAMISGLSLAAIATTTVYILIRQRLFAHSRTRTRLSEQIVVSNVSTSVIVLCGMLTTYALLFATTFLLSWLLFHNRLASQWAAEQTSAISTYCLLSGFVASVGIFIGALGASFEQQYYFRHITLVDEET